MTFELALTEDKVKPHQITALHLLAALAFMGTGAIFYWLYQPVQWWVIALLAGGLALLVASVFMNRWVRQPKVNVVLRIAELAMAGYLVYFTGIRHAWPPMVMYSILAATMLFALFWENGGNTLQVHIGADGIRLPLSSRKRFLAWKEVDQVLLRYGTLTIDCENNHMYQWTIRPAAFDNEIFEAFCTSQIEANKHKRSEDW